MSLGPLIDIGIGLVFVYLLLGLITTAAQELVASYLEWRGKLLRQALVDLLGNGSASSSLFQGVFGHGLVRGNSSDRLPSYLSSQRFTLALFDTLTQGSSAPAFTQIETAIGGLPAGSAREGLLALVRDAEGDLDKLKTSVAGWFDDVMDRLSGYYKRRSQVFAVLFGIGAAVLLNVDSLHIAQTLAHDDMLRTQVAALAATYEAAHKEPAQTSTSADRASVQISSAMQSLSDLHLPIGWDDALGTIAAKNEKAGVRQSQFVEWIRAIGFYFYSLGLGGAILVLLGWLITGAAASLGAPFWFDVLSSVLNIRGAGPKPERHGTKQGAVS